MIGEPSLPPVSVRKKMNIRDEKSAFDPMPVQSSRV
jgi:hypothetical protein